MIDTLQIKALRPTLINASVVTIFLCLRHLGFFVVFEILILIPWMVMSFWIIIMQPQRRSIQLAKMGIWLLSVGIVIGVHYVVATQTRLNAQKIVDAVLSYHASHGIYPKEIKEIGYTEENVRAMIGMGGYFFAERGPSFFYASTYVPFETDHYDFSTHEWQHRD